MRLQPAVAVLVFAAIPAGCAAPGGAAPAGRPALVADPIRPPAPPAPEPLVRAAGEGGEGAEKGEKGDKPGGKPSIAEWVERRDRARLTPDLLALAEELKDRDRADRDFDWWSVRHIKDQYNLFNPTPRPLRREFVTDRPDKTINPVTVDAGTLQVETDLVTATFDRRQPRTAGGAGGTGKTGTGGFLGQQPFTPGDKDDYVFLLTNLRLGLTNNTDLHVFVRPFQRLATPAAPGAPATDAFGYGDMRALLKENLWGNEGGFTAFCLTQYLDVPAGRPDLSTQALEGGTTGALLVRFPGKTYLGFESGLELRKDIGGGRYHVEVPASVSLAKAFTKELSAKAEFAAVFTTQRGARWVGVASFAALYGLSDDIQFDIGINIGVTPAANDWNPYIGLAKRF